MQLTTIYRIKLAVLGKTFYNTSTYQWELLYDLNTAELYIILFFM